MRISNSLITRSPELLVGRGSRVFKVSDHGWPCHEFKPSTTKDPPFENNTPCIHPQKVCKREILLIGLAAEEDSSMKQK
ncbi:hypothetical protein TNCV_4990591 [Trichonephila clavipes]|nr:hypothetical protein TNCV_4990591 [Trichonephila clavipes]